MSGRSGYLKVVSLVGIDFIDEGRSLKMELTDSVPPYCETVVLLKNTYLVKLFRCTSEPFPAIIVDFYWNEISRDDLKTTLRDCDFPFFNDQREPFVDCESLVCVQLEGDITGTILVESIEFPQTGS